MQAERAGVKDGRPAGPEHDVARCATAAPGGARQERPV